MEKKATSGGLGVLRREAKRVHDPSRICSPLESNSLSGGGRGQTAGRETERRLRGAGPQPHPTPLSSLPPTTGQLISQYKHSSRTGVTAPPAARLREAQPGRPGREAGGAAGITLSATRAGLGAGRPGARIQSEAGVPGGGGRTLRAGGSHFRLQSGWGRGGHPRGTPTSLQRGLNSEEALTPEQVDEPAQGGQRGGPAGHSLRAGPGDTGEGSGARPSWASPAHPPAHAGTPPPAAHTRASPPPPQPRSLG